MLTKLYKTTLMAAASFSVSLLLTVAPVAAQTPSTSGNYQDQSQSGRMNQSQTGSDQSQSTNGQSATILASSGQQATQSGPSSTIEGAGGPFAGSVSISPHSSQWYRFKYGYFPRSDDKDSDSNSPSQAKVELKMDTGGCVSFEIWTPNRLNAPAPTYTSDDKDRIVRTPVGVGSQVYRGVDQSKSRSSASRTITDAKDLIWVGGAALNNTYYIRVRNQTDAVCNYNLSVSGPDVSYQQAR